MIHYLKSVHIHGFKSFADKLILDFQPGVNVVVGPNGSGKSNIADAVRWVLGEQSIKSLRGSKMEDIIFVGSHSRRQVSRAEVTLIFDNTTRLFPLDYEEVTISRCIYRDGDAEFHINRVPCRLKDIQELFLDTGSGKEGFSIIGQGRVEEILNARADERRYLIEEVAGISKYRVRKKEAVRKLTDTQQNIDRLMDIIIEVEERLGPLAKQAEQARKYVQLNEELRATEVCMIVQSLEELKQQNDQAHQEIDRLNIRRDTQAASLAQQEKTATDQRTHLNALDQKMQTVQDDLHKRTNDLQDLQHEITLLEERETHMAQQTSRLDQDMGSSQEKNQAAQTSLEHWTQRQTEIHTQASHIENTLKCHEDDLQRLRRLSGAERLEAIKDEIFDALTAETNWGNQMRELDRQIDMHRRGQAQLDAEIARVDKGKKALESDLADLENSLADAHTVKAGLETTVSALEHSLNEKAAQWQEVSDKLARLIRRLDQNQARWQTLKSIQESREGYFKGVKEILDAYAQGKVSCGALYGAVAENISVDKKYEPAIEVALGSAMQNLIIDTSDSAKKCIAYLKAHKSGRATFLPLDDIRGTLLSLPSSIKKNPGYLGLAVELIRFDKKFTRTMEYLLGRIIIVTDLDAGVAISRACGQRYRIVTLTQDQINIGGALTGGSFQSKSHLLGSTRELETLAETIAVLETEHAQQNLVLKQNAHECDSLKDTLKTAQTDLQKSLEKISLRSASHQHIQEKIAREAEMVTMITTQKQELAEQIVTALANHEEAADKRDTAQKQVHRLKEDQAALDEEARSYAEQADTTAERITVLKVELARLREEHDQMTQRIADEKKEYTQEQDRIQQRLQEKEQLLQASARSADTRVQMEEQVKQDQQALTVQKDLLAEDRIQKEHLARDLNTLEEEIKQIRENLAATNNQTHHIELKCARSLSDWEAGLDRLESEWNLTWEEAVEEAGRCTHAQVKDEEEPEGSAVDTEIPTPKTKALAKETRRLQKRVQEIRKALAQLGAVNHTALEEHPAMVERYNFLKTQYDDLIAASTKLTDFIGELDQVMQEKFAQGFEEVNKAFSEVFCQLFEGGHAHLSLDQPDNLLETGINIIAQPPGKKPQLLSLLSGGERAFTAIALLFAMLKVKPSPFCIMDEIESALDETNVRRFIQYVRRLSSNTQFILISHRRGTMEAADRLYGVSMEESGVSKLLTIELDQFGTQPAERRELSWLDS
ncbi:MAG: chromosome segregation protein SMC [Peptococcaceae bacterium]|nr:chromosome segregation protein SMC [Peptococcaceae bacterium]